MVSRIGLGPQLTECLHCYHMREEGRHARTELRARLRYPPRWKELRRPHGDAVCSHGQPATSIPCAMSRCYFWQHEVMNPSVVGCKRQGDSTPLNCDEGAQKRKKRRGGQRVPHRTEQACVSNTLPHLVGRPAAHTRAMRPEATKALARRRTPFVAIFAASGPALSYALFCVFTCDWGARRRDAERSPRHYVVMHL